MRKLSCTPLGTPSAFCYMSIVFLQAITLKLLGRSAFLDCVEVNKCVNFQIPRYKGFKVGIFRISPIGVSLIKWLWRCFKIMLINIAGAGTENPLALET